MLFNAIIRVKPYQFLYINFYILFFLVKWFHFPLLFKTKFIQVLHGCLQSVLWKVRLNPLTDAIPSLNFNLRLYNFDKKLFGAKTSPYGPHELGYRRAIKTFTKWSKTSLFKEVKDKLIIKKSQNNKLMLRIVTWNLVAWRRNFE